MPQMAPISWLLLLFIVFSITYILFCSISYYSYMPSSPKCNELKNINLNLMSW